MDDLLEAVESGRAADVVVEALSQGEEVTVKRGVAAGRADLATDRR
ncbi:MAG: hypothetical protein ACYDHF_08905 [Candidatus Cryosericum sp.]